MKQAKTFKTKVNRSMRNLLIRIAFLLVAGPILAYSFLHAMNSVGSTLGQGNPYAAIPKECSAIVSGIKDLNEQNRRFAECSKERMAQLQSRPASGK